MNDRGANALVLFSDGFEEIETVTIVDVLRRAEIEVTTASPNGGTVTGAHGIRVEAERRFADVRADDFDAIVLPGGTVNAKTLASNEQAQRLIQEARRLDRVVAAICAAPLALKAAGVIRGAKLTSYPSTAAAFAGERYLQERVVKDGRLLTSRGPGTSIEFALALVAELCGAGRAASVAEPMLVG